MHAYFLSRGIKSRMNEWENDLGAEWMPLKYKKPDGKIIDGRVKLAIREVKLHEVVFPKEYEEAVMGLISPNNGRVWGKWGRVIRCLVSVLGLKKPMKKFKKNNRIHSDGISTVCLGTKEDIMNFNISEPVQDNGVIPQEDL